MRVRLIGTAAECRAVLAVLTGQAETPLTVRASEPLPDDAPVRVQHLEVDLPPVATYSARTGCCNECGAAYPGEPHPADCRWS